MIDVIGRWTGCCVAAVFMMSCATTQPKPDDVPVLSSAEREAQLLAIKEFSFEGALGIWNDQQALPARIRWTQSGQALDVQLNGPLGIGNMRLIENNEGVASLYRGEVLLTSGDSAGEVLQRGLSLEAPVPVDQIQLWVRGLPGDAVSVARDSENRITSLRYVDSTGTDWVASIRKYETVNHPPVGGDITVPSLITARSERYSVRIVLKNWQLAPSSAVPKVHESNKRLAIPVR